MSRATDHPSILTRRAILARAPAAIAVAGSVTLPAMASTPDDCDPVVPLWRKYFAVECQIRALNRRYDEIWNTQPEDVRHPRVQYATSYVQILPKDVPPTGVPLYVSSAEQIEKLEWPIPAEDGGLDACRARLKVRLAEAERVSDELRDQLGLTRMAEKHERLTERLRDLMTAIEEAVATTPAGYAAKVLFHLANVDADGIVRDYPHCAQVSLLRDLLPHLPDDIARVVNRFVSVGEFSSAMIGETLFADDDVMDEARKAVRRFGDLERATS